MKCECGRVIGYFDKYCNYCKKNISLRDKVIDDIRHDKMYGDAI